MLRHLRPIVGIVILILAACAVMFLPQLQETFSSGVEMFGIYINHNQIAAITIFIFLAALSAAFAPVSSVPLVPFAVAAWGSVLTLILLMAGWMLGASFAYLVGKYGAYPLLRHFSIYRDIEHRKNNLSGQSQFWIVLLFRFISPAEIPGYVLGSLRYNFSKYLVATFMTELPIGIVTAFASQALLERQMSLFIALVTAMVAAFVIVFLVFREKIYEVLQ